MEINVDKEEFAKLIINCNDGVCSNCALNEVCGKIEELIEMCDVN